MLPADQRTLRSEYVVACPVSRVAPVAECRVYMGERSLPSGTGEWIRRRCQAYLEGRGCARALEGSGHEFVSRLCLSPDLWLTSLQSNGRTSGDLLYAHVRPLAKKCPAFNTPV